MSDIGAKVLGPSKDSKQWVDLRVLFTSTNERTRLKLSFVDLIYQNKQTPF
jgi:hypothetical protein